MPAGSQFALVYRQVEENLARKNPSALSPRARMVRERLLPDVETLGSLLSAGLPVGAISEMVGPAGSGRTTAATAFAAAAVQSGKVAAWVDVSNAFDPTGAAVNGVDLERLLWVRCDAVAAPQREVAQRAVTHVTQPAETPLPVRGGGSPHPRAEIRGMPEAVRNILAAHGGLHQHQSRRERKKIGTPGMPNRLFGPSPYREEQVNSDRAPSRQAVRRESEAVTARCAEPVPAERKVSVLPKPAPGSVTLRVASRSREGLRRSAWSALDNALRATDLLLQSGGFGLIVLDLGDTPPEKAWRVPLATWFRYRAGCERSRTTLLVLTQHACTQSSAEMVVRFEPGTIVAEGNVMTGFSFCARTERQRFATQPEKVVSIRKPPQSERPGEWRGRAAWAV